MRWYVLIIFIVAFLGAAVAMYFFSRPNILVSNDQAQPTSAGIGRGTVMDKLSASNDE